MEFNIFNISINQLFRLGPWLPVRYFLQSLPEDNSPKLFGIPSHFSTWRNGHRWRIPKKLQGWSTVNGLLNVRYRMGPPVDSVNRCLKKWLKSMVYGRYNELVNDGYFMVYKPTFTSQRFSPSCRDGKIEKPCCVDEKFTKFNIKKHEYSCEHRLLT